jgi:magnesium-transporting ATPase (P-type)
MSKVDKGTLNLLYLIMTAKRKTTKKTASYKKSYSKLYTKRPTWQWVLIYLIIGGLIYFVVYYLVMARNNSVNIPTTSNTPTYSLPGY